MSLVLRIVLYLVVLFLLVCFGAWLYLFTFGGLESIVNKKIASLLDPSHHVEVTIGTISGSILHDATVENVTAYYVDGDVRRLILQIPSLTVTYKFSSIINQEIKLDNVTLESPTALFYQDSTGKLLLPTFGSADSSKPKSNASSASDIEINSIAIHNGSARLFRIHDTLVVDSLQLGVSLTIDEKTISSDVDVFSCLFQGQAVRVGDGKNAVALAGKSVILQGVTLLVNDSRLGLEGVLSWQDSLTGTLTVDADHIDMKTVNVFTHGSLTGLIDLNGTIILAGDNIKGDISTSGTFMGASFNNLYLQCNKIGDSVRLDTLYGSVLNNCTLDGKGELVLSKPEQYWLAAHILNFDLSEIMHDGFSTDLNGTIYVEGSSFDSKTMALTCTVDLFESSFDKYPLQAASGTFLVTADSIQFSDGFQVQYYANEFVASGRVAFKGNMDLSLEADIPELFRYQDELSGAEVGGRVHISATLTGPTKNPNAQGTLTSDSLWVYNLFADSAAIRFAVPNILSHATGTLDVQLFAGNAWGLAFDTAVATLHLDSGVVIFDSVRAISPDANLLTKGSFRYDVKPQWLVCDTLDFILFERHFVNDGQIAVGIDSTGFQFRQAVLREGSSHASIVGTVRSNQSMDVTLDLRDAPIGRWISLYDSTLRIDGNVSGELFLRGTFDAPQFRVEMRADSLHYQDFEAGTLELSARYADKLLTLDSSRLSAPGRQLVATGYLPCDLAFKSEVVDRFPDQPINLSIYSIDSVLDIFEFLFPQIEELDSIFIGDLSITGTARKPILKGSGTLVDMKLKYFDLGDRLYADTVRIGFENDRIIIDSVHVYAFDNDKKKRYAYIDGSIQVPSIDTLVYNLHVKTDREFPVSYELADKKGKIQADLNIIGPTPPTGSGEVTTITGKVTVSEMLDLTSFSEPSYGPQLFDALAGEQSWNINVAISLPGKYHIQNENIDAEFSGDLTFIREAGRQRLFGTMEIERGKAYLFDKTFSLDQGGQISFDGSETFNPSLDITAHTRIPSASTSSADIREDLDLAVHITGTLDVPEFNTVEGSQFSREDILPLLVANYYAGDTAGYSGNLEGRISNVVSAQLSQFGTKSLRRLGVETFEINAGTTGGTIDPSKSRVTAGGTLVSNFYVYGSTALDRPISGSEVGFEYRFARSMLLEGRRDELDLFHLNMILHWDF